MSIYNEYSYIILKKSSTLKFRIPTIVRHSLLMNLKENIKWPKWNIKENGRITH